MLIHVLDLQPKHRLLPIPADWYPIYINQRLFLDQNVHFRFFSSPSPSLTNCDYLFLSSRYFSLHAKNASARTKALEQISLLTDQSKTVWFDFRDSTGNTQFEVLPYVNLYLKKQLLNDLTLYQQSFYGNRIYTDYIHKHFNVTDSYDDSCAPLPPALAFKLGISWNPGLLDFRGGTNGILLFHLLTDRLESRSKFKHLINWQDPQSLRTYHMLAQFSTNYARQTVSWQRRNIVHHLRRINDPRIVFAQKISLAQEISIRYQSKIVLSLFGWGEICSRDFQAFIAGSCLLAADTSHLTTWPTTHIPYQTYIPIKWDLSDVNIAYSRLLEDDNLRLSIASTAQTNYQRIWSLAGRHEFCHRLINQIKSISQLQPHSSVTSQTTIPS